MLKEYKKAEEIINNIIENIPQDMKKSEFNIVAYIYVKIANMLEYDDHAAELIDAHLGGFDRERTYDNIVYPASDIRCLIRGRAICKGYAEVLNVILNKLNIKTIKVSSKGHEWNQVLINGNWYNCDLTNDADFIKENKECKYFLKSDADIKRKPINESHECTSSLRRPEQLCILEQARIKVEKENRINTLNKIKEKMKGKISTDDLFVACQVKVDFRLIEPFVQYESFGKEFHKIIIDPKRTLIIKQKHGKEDIYFNTYNMEAIIPLNFSTSYYSKSSSNGTVYFGYISHTFNSGIGSFNDKFIKRRQKDLNQKGYLMTFREFIKKKLGINVDKVTIKEANALLKLANIVRPRKFALSENLEEAKGQLDKKVYMKKTKKEN